MVLCAPPQVASTSAARNACHLHQFRAARLFLSSLQQLHVSAGRSAGNQRSRALGRRGRHVAHCSTMQADEVYRSIAENGEVSLLVVRGTQIVQEAVRRHKTAPTASAALGRAMMGTLLIGCFRGEEETTQVTFQADGPLQGIQVLSNARGQVRGKVGNPAADPPLRADGKLDVGGAVGKGVLAVVRNHPLADSPYTGMVPVATGEVAEDLAAYLADSEQVNCALGLGVSINKDASVRAAGGFLVQVLPFASEQTLSSLERSLAGVPSMTEMLHEGMTPQQIGQAILGDLASPSPGFSLRPEYGPCEPSSLKMRMKRAVALLGEEEVRDILAKEGKIEVTCEFCKDVYQFGFEEVMAALEESRS